MPDTGTGTDPTMDRCPDCGHPLDAWCDCECCMFKAERWLESEFTSRSWSPFGEALEISIGRAREARRGVR